MSTEERLRAATRARADLVRDVRPLELPDELPASARSRLRRARPAGRSRRWLSWGAPLAAAAVIALVAVLLVVARQSAAPPPAPPVPVTPSAGSVPRYYVALNIPGGAGTLAPGAQEPSSVLVGDDRDGSTVATVDAPAGQVFTAVSGAADDRTFVLIGYVQASRQATWYLLHIGGTVTLKRLPGRPMSGQPNGLALSPDGRQVALMVAGSSLELKTYSVSTGALLRTWQTSATYWNTSGAQLSEFSLSWVANGSRIAFQFDGYVSGSRAHTIQVRLLDVTASGHDLLADSRVVLQPPPLVETKTTDNEPCAQDLVSPDGTAVICATVSFLVGNPAKCPAATAAFGRYSATSGKLVRPLYQYPGGCHEGTAQALWASASGDTVIGALSVLATDAGPASKLIGVIENGRFTPLKVSPVVTQSAAQLQTFVAF